MKLLVSVDGNPGELSLDRTPEGFRLHYASERGDEARETSLVRVEPGFYSVLLNGRSYEAKVVAGPDGYCVDIDGHRSMVEIRDPRAALRRGARGIVAGGQTVSAPMPGKVVRILVTVGDRVEPGDSLVVVEAMKMQNELKAGKSGTVIQVGAAPGATVALGEMLVVIE